MTREQHPIPAILVVEDHPPTLALVQQMLSAAFPDCRILGVESAESALEQCARHAPHVIVMDISLPGMNGIEATRRIKALNADVRVVMHSNHDLPAYRDAALAAGASEFVAKRAALSDLVPAIAERLRGSGAPDRIVKIP